MEHSGTISILGQEIKLERPFLFIESELQANNLEKDFPLISFPYSSFYEKLTENKPSLLDFLFQFYTLTQSSNQIPQEWNIFWSKITGSFKQTQKILSVTINLMKINDLKHSYIKAIQQKQILKEYSEKFLLLKEIQSFEYNQKLLDSLTEELAAFSPEYEVKADEYASYKNRLLQYEEMKKNHSFEEKKLKDKQRELYHQTNLITEEMDEIFPHLDTYQKKIDKLDPIHNQEDFDRITKKHSELEEKYNDLKNQKNDLMKHSQLIKRQLVDSKREFRDSTKKYHAFLPEFNQIQKDFEEYEKKYSLLNTRIAEVKNKLEDVISSQDIQMSQQMINENMIPFTSKLQIDRALQANAEEIQYFENQLKNIFNTTNIDEIDAQILEKTKKVENKLKEYQDITEIELYSNFGQEISFFIQFLLEIIEILNPLLEGINLKFSMFFELDKSQPMNYVLTEKILHKNKELISIEDLNRWETSYFYFSLFFSSWCAIHKDVVPIYLDNIPHTIITDKTFHKAINLLRNRLSYIDIESFPSFIFFIPPKKYSLKPNVLISNE